MRGERAGRGAAEQGGGARRRRRVAALEVRRCAAAPDAAVGGAYAPWVPFKCLTEKRTLSVRFFYRGATRARVSFS